MNDFIDYLHEVFSRFGPISVRRMFGGYGISREGLTFALVIDDTLYLKADEGNVEHFTKAGLSRFEYQRDGKTMGMNYYVAPADLMDDRDEAAIWARRSFEAALRAQSKKKPKKAKAKNK